MAFSGVASSLLASSGPVAIVRLALQLGAPMLDREKIVAVLRRRFAGAGADQIAAATNAIVGLDDEWEELALMDPEPCSESCYLAKVIEGGSRLKVLRRRVNHGD
jgi:hypothetical protein